MKYVKKDSNKPVWIAIIGLNDLLPTEYVYATFSGVRVFCEVHGIKVVEISACQKIGDEIVYIKSKINGSYRI